MDEVRARADADLEDLALGQGDEPLANLADGLGVAEDPY
jgi:hypothetical protein